MKIIHRIGFNEQKTFEDDLIKFGINYKKLLGPSGSYLITFDIDEAHPNWPEISNRVKAINASDIAKTVFTKKEILEAKYLRILPNYLWSYPQPENEWESTIYDNWCQTCGIGQQKQSFRIDKEPTLGKSVFLSLFWAYPIFCFSTALNLLDGQNCSGYERWPVIIHSTNLPSKYIEQVFIANRSQPPTVETKGLQKTHCHECNRDKYVPVKRGMMRVYEKALAPNSDIQQTYEYFGSGHEAFRETIISNRLAKIILKYGWKGLKIEPVTLLSS